MTQLMAVVRAWLRPGILLVLCWVLGISGCASGGGLRDFADGRGEFRFAYPNGMVSTDPGVNKDRKILLHDLIDESEMVSLMVSAFDQAGSIRELGTPAEVAARVAEKMIAPAGGNRTTQLVQAGQFTDRDQPYYVLEYATQAGSQSRHDLVTVTIHQHKLYTLFASTPDQRWPTVKEQFYEVAQSLRVG